jgi:very-short-patch-repair endonuclease
MAFRPDNRGAQVRRARRLRREQSWSEVRLWSRLRRGGVGAPVRRQHPIGPLIVDFAVPSRRLAIEVDGAGHDPIRDVERDRILVALGWRVHRIPVQALDHDLDEVLIALAQVIEDPAVMD